MVDYMPTFEKYCDKCGQPDRRLANVNGRMLCPRCRGLHVEEDDTVTRKKQLRKLWGV
jgi:uncharacterized Zn finger protein (UPF0148 family)